jgi:hypothetical protein
MIRGERAKNWKARRGCIACHCIGAASPAFAYITVKYIPRPKFLNPTDVTRLTPEVLSVEKELGLCFKHCRQHTEKNPGALLDPEVGKWNKVFGQMMPIRDELYQLYGGPENTKIITGPAGQIPTWW